MAPTVKCPLQDIAVEHQYTQVGKSSVRNLTNGF